jgi:non-heme chloroperoxidase
MVASPARGTIDGPTVTMADGTVIYFKDWGTGQPIVFSHGWPLSSDAWEAQMFFLASNGYRGRPDLGRLSG